MQLTALGFCNETDVTCTCIKATTVVPHSYWNAVSPI